MGTAAGQARFARREPGQAGFRIRLERPMTDERVSFALRQWGPRFVARGIDYGDLLSLSERMGSWDDWLPLWSELGREWEAVAAAARSRRSAGAAWQRAALAHHFGRFLAVADEAAYLAASHRAVAAHRRAVELLDPTAERIEVTLGPAAMAGVLRLPAGPAPAPLVVLVPGLDSTKEEFWSWSELFLERGLATLAIDGPGQGEGGYGEGRMRADYERAVAGFLDALSGHPRLDLDRVGLIGVSVGGYYAPRAAAYEPRVRAVVAISGPFDLAECWDGFPELTRAKLRYHLGASRPPEVRARLAGFHLREAAAALDRPLLVIGGRQDRLIPAAHAERLAAAAPRAQLCIYETGNHACSNLHWRHAPLEADWLASRLDA